MATIDKLHVALSAVTPLFIGGAQPNEEAELRAPSIKGLLRFWYRALDGDCRTSVNGTTREDRFFGSTSSGQSPCLLRVDPWQTGQVPWNREQYRRHEQQGGIKRGFAPDSPNGIAYLGYSLALGQNDRKALGARTAFSLDALARPGLGDDTRRAWLAATWLLVHLGGVGSRSRRGLGSLRIESWEGWDACAKLPLACTAQSPDAWRQDMEQALAVLRGWFPTRPTVDYTVLADGARMLLVRQGHTSWERALDDAGLRLQRFRQRREPDYTAVKQYLAAGEQGKLAGGPERAGFGLPLAFRYSSLATGPNRQATPTVEFVDAQHDRMASPLFVRVVRLGDGYHAAYAHLAAPWPPGGNLQDKRKEQPIPWHPDAGDVVGRFLDECVRADSVEVVL